MANEKILVVDVEESMCNFLSIMLKKEGYQITTALSAKEALKKLDKNTYDVVISDLKMEGMNGLELLDEINKKDTASFVIIMTAFATIESAIEALKKGAFDYITKPFKVDEIKLAVTRALEQRKIRTENVYLKKQLQKKEAFGEIIGTVATVVVSVITAVIEVVTGMIAAWDQVMEALSPIGDIFSEVGGAIGDVVGELCDEAGTFE